MATMAPEMGLPRRVAVGSSVDEQRILRRLLHAEVDGGARRQHVVAAPLGDALDFLEGPVQEPVRAIRAPRLDDLGGVQPRSMHLPGAHVAGLDHVVQHVVGARAGGRQVDVRRVFRRRLEQAGQQRGFGQRQLARRMAEIELRGGLDAERAAAEIGAIEIELQDLALGEARLEQEGEIGLLDLALDRALGRQEQVLGELLGQRRAALHHLVGLGVGDQGAGRAEEVDAEVLEEAPVLGGQRRLDQVSPADPRAARHRCDACRAGRSRCRRGPGT